MYYKNCHKDLDDFITAHFSASYMSNAKWDKLIEALTVHFEVIHVRFKLVYSETVADTSFDMADHYPFFIEPISYKEVEWIEFPAIYEGYVNPNNLKAGKKTYQQDLETIESILQETGKFKTGCNATCIRLYAYDK